ncbi:MAG: hypothetical protein A3D74_04965 [Candidatus Levybacteria bacterium RIFCSPHIGHO2_02_FULL_37_13]|nr:MAG: hypothetical protein A3D74_04965 [Candidatus Levybacteria bacterium RIFCSPHIGHO2_02_FULL_37_13]OGH30427.1 MAG: hypothetical protein A3E40_05285 [Candidatus Levybacteria bacterium RIFCSPHIGHO2_12_FULL_37_9]OGH40149.1 MAG: hypothetical protein A3B41_04840 [Candidatus Levybacteria bacterium RIFCSPLOWO2_01_FULL_37_26]
MVEFSNGESLLARDKVVSGQQWDSGHKGVALKTLEKVLMRKISLAHPESSKEAVRNQVLEKREKLNVWLDAIDNEVVKNFGVFESKENPGVRFPFTKVVVRNVANSIQNSPVDSDSENLPEKTIVLFTPFMPPPGGAPDDIMNIIYDRVLTAVPDITKRDSHKARNITVYALGLPTSNWGSISEEWLNNLKENGFSEYGKLYAEFLAENLGQDSLETQQKRKFLFFAGSMGTVLASETAKQLPKIWKNLTLLLNNPTGVHSPSDKTIKLPVVGRVPLSVKGLQVVAGFGAEAGIRMALDDFVKSALSGPNKTREALSDVLLQKGIIPYESEQQNKLKKIVNGEAIKSLMRGNPVETDSYRIFIEQGMLDPATTTGEKIELLQSKSKKERFFKAGKHALGMGVNYTHWMDPMRWPDKWIRGIESYEKAVDAQTKQVK